MTVYQGIAPLSAADLKLQLERELQQQTLASTTTVTPGALKPCNEDEWHGIWDPFYRPLYQPGMILDLDGFRQEQGYRTTKRNLATRLHAGYGLQWGLDFSVQDNLGLLSVGPLYAIDELGRALWLKSAQIMNLAEWLGDNGAELGGSTPTTVYVSLAFQACGVSPVPAIPAPCDDVTQRTRVTRLLETAVPLLSLEPPPAAVDLDALWRIDAVLAGDSARTFHALMSLLKGDVDRPLLLGSFQAQLLSLTATPFTASSRFVHAPASGPARRLAGFSVVHVSPFDSENGALDVRFNRPARMAENQSFRVDEIVIPEGDGLGSYTPLMKPASKVSRDADDPTLLHITGIAAPASEESLIRVVVYGTGRSPVMGDDYSPNDGEAAEPPNNRSGLVALGYSTDFQIIVPQGAVDGPPSTDPAPPLPQPSALGLFEFAGNVLDTSGNARSMALLGGAQFVPGDFGTAMRLAGYPAGGPPADWNQGLDWSAYTGLLQRPFTIEMVYVPRSTDSTIDQGLSKLFSFNDVEDSGWYWYQPETAFVTSPFELLGAGLMFPDERHYVTLISTGPSTVDIYFRGVLIGSDNLTSSSWIQQPPPQALFFSDDTQTSRTQSIAADIEGIRILRGDLSVEAMAAQWARLQNPPHDGQPIFLPRSCISIANGALAWWDADAVNGTTAGDLLNGFNGSMSGGVSVVEGIVGNCFKFDDTRTGVVTGPATINVTGLLTLEAWVAPSDPLAGLQLVVSKQRDDDGDNSYALGIADTGGIYFALHAGLAKVACVGNARLEPNKWSHIAGVWDGEAMRIYLNGVEQPELRAFGGPIRTSGEPLRIGKGDTANRAFQGRIDEVTIYANALTATEIEAIAAATYLGKCKVITHAPPPPDPYGPPPPPPAA